MNDIDLTIALDLYDRHMPFFLGIVAPPEGIRITALEVGMVPPRRHGTDRHARMLHRREFDVCEVSLASYIMAITRGAPLTAVPVFPRRLFSQNHIFVNSAAGIATPEELVGRKVAIWAFQVTMSVLAKGDLKRAYGVPWQDIHWLTMHDEELAWTAEDGVRIERLPGDADVADLLAAGEIDGLINPHPPAAVMSGDERIRRLFPDPVAEAEQYFRKYGYYPIMHLLVMRRELADRVPGLPRELIRMWEDAKAQAAAYYTDPGFSELAFARNEYERQRDTFAPDLWPSGLRANRDNLEAFLADCHDQRLVDQPVLVEDLFHPTVLET